MNRFELFCLIFRVLNDEWLHSRDPVLGDYLSSANPYLFEEIDSAVSYVYDEFCELVPERVPLEDSYAVAADYIASLEPEYDVVKEAFAGFSQDEWMRGAKEYLASDHKGKDA